MKKTIIPLLNIALILFGVALLLSCGGNNNDTKTRYIITSKIFKEFKGTKELEKKFVALQDKQKYILDSLGLEIQTLEKFSRSNSGILFKKKQTYDQLSAQFSQSNQEQYKQYSEGIWKQINQYLNDYGKENHLSYIYGADGTGSLMYADSTLNVTEHVIAFINKKYEGD
ncbi:MAG TPA: OmpH family outer membrane protein [Cytophagaceae bacterium]|jgi:outer membrane protein|nr:OmpH family outer membrane protein [Cytophagaceae bacterium]